MLTPQQIADLRSPSNIRGNSPAGPLWHVTVALVAFERMQVLTDLAELSEILWYYLSTTGPRVDLMTNRPEFFAELEHKILEAQHGR